ncbi:MAG: hypothetical protein U0835_06860 [Isosphaeraceae bacterium]
MAAYVLLMGVADLLLTGGATLTINHTTGTKPRGLEERLSPVVARGEPACRDPVPQDLVGFVAQSQHQRSGGSSYLLGERRERGWWYYYLVALAVKVPAGVFLLVALAEAFWARDARRGRRRWMIPVLIAGFLAITAAAGFLRNYGVRYLLQRRSLAVVWVSAARPNRGFTGRRRGLLRDSSGRFSRWVQSTRTS